MSCVRLIVKNVEQLVQVCCNKEQFKSGQQQDDVALLERRPDGVGCCIAVDNDGYIVDVGYDDQILPKYSSDTIVDGKNCSLIPGLVDSHTHPVFGGDRCFEFDMKMKGATYLDIHKQGGGIYYTVRETAKAPFSDLLANFEQRLQNMRDCGTTLVECKTGYGLDYETELKMLRVIDCIRKNNKNVDLVVNFLGAHAIPEGMNAEQGVESVIKNMKLIKEQVPDLKVDFVDVFCETGVYDVNQSTRILLEGKKIFNAGINFHGDELTALGAGEMAKKIGAKAVSHLEYLDSNGIKAMASANIVAIMCPTTAYLLKLKNPPVRQMITSGVPVAVATDFNPNAYCYSLPMAMNLAVVNFGMTLNEALVATTINAAFALNKSNSFGSLEKGKVGDMILLNTNHWKHIIYEFGDIRKLIKCVIKRGSIF
ncbi:putative imidazolonepropionase-like isoform X1 [Leptotrombidium deliense]|uniref:Probable imidazolonepropionase n=1 Tax=Leptotrombidium deliense TaxID=299467 RepID=A0A443SM34_9ACAR|nr:putative imidazolonepropionase-like isoform X1 [Leptotrombidium deliense]